MESARLVRAFLTERCAVVAFRRGLCPCGRLGHEDAECPRFGARSEVARAKPASVTEAQTASFCFSVGATSRGFTGPSAPPLAPPNQIFFGQLHAPESGKRQQFPTPFMFVCMMHVHVGGLVRCEACKISAPEAFQRWKSTACEFLLRWRGAIFPTDSRRLNDVILILGGALLPSPFHGSSDLHWK